MINVLVNGSHGNMGKVLINYIKELPDIKVLYQIDKNMDISPTPKPDVIIDFSTTKGTLQILDYAAQHLIPIVIATTGFSDSENKRILEYSEAIPIFKASNMSYTIHLIAKVLATFSPFLSNMDIEIVDKHHNRKVDAPSGTALLLADSINSTLENKYTYVFDRLQKKEKRKKNEIGFSSIRGGNLVGEHSVLFLGDSETIEIKHTAYSRTVYAEGAVRAARFIIHKKNGLYHMEDLIS